MATENVSKLIPFVIVGARSGQAAVSKLVMYAIVNGNTPAPPPTPLRRTRVALLYGKTAGLGIPPPSAPSNNAAPVILGAVVGTPTTLTNGTWIGTAPITFSYKWYVAGLAVMGATGQSYTPVSGDSGKSLYGVVTAHNSAGDTAQPSNVLTVTVTPVVPSNTGAPSVNQAFVGSPSTCSTGTWTGTAPITFAYQWRLNSVAIMGATTNTYTPLSGDTGGTLDCVVTANNVTMMPVSAVSNALTVADNSYIDVASWADMLTIAALGPVASGGKSYRLPAGDLGSIAMWGIDFRSNPMLISGQETDGATTCVDFATNSSGVTFRKITATGASTPSIQINDHATVPPILVFDQFLTDSGTAMGTQSGAGILIQCPTLPGGSITVLGRNDATKPDIWGRTYAIAITGVQIGGGTVLLKHITYRNISTDGIIGGGAQNITIDGCFAADMFNAGGHPDAIQFFSNGSIPTTNLTVVNCGVQRGVGDGSQGVFLENCVNVLVQDTWVYDDTENNAFSNSAGSGQTNDNCFTQTFTSTGRGGVMIARGGAVNSVNTNNSVSYLVNNSVSITGPYSTDGVNPGYVPGSNLGSNALVPAASTYGDYTQFDIWKAAHPNARPRL